LGNLPESVVLKSSGETPKPPTMRIGHQSLGVLRDFVVNQSAIQDRIVT
jgi:hypothetical protein